jgi:light-regulated signal transduction histidine kinase (bacteriophytochrome)
VHTLDGFAILEAEAEAAVHGVGTDGYALVRRAAARLQGASTLRSFCAAAAEEVRRATGFDQVLIYRFHLDHHGEVFAESKREDLPPLLGLHYPAGDIPIQAREIFKKIWLRPLPDAAGALHELVPLANPDTGRALDMTHCVLRGASIMYTDYVKNMGVDAALTMAIRVEGQLWGLVTCQHRSGPMPVPWPVRAACELLAQVVSLQLKAAEDREHFDYRLRIEEIHQQLVAEAAQEGGLSAMFDGHRPLLAGLDARGAALFHRRRWWRVGHTPEEPQLRALADWLLTRPELASSTRPIYVTDALSRAWPEGAALAEVASGVLAVSLSRSQNLLMLWFRPETRQEVRWAGDPNDKPTVASHRGPSLTPRARFEVYLESVRGRSLPWLPVEVEAAARLRVLLMELVVSRADQLAALNVDLSRSNEELDAFAYVAGHDLKEPLRGIHKHAHHLLTDVGATAEERRARVEGLVRLTARMDQLLDSLLHYSHVGRMQLASDAVDLGQVLADALEIIGSRVAERTTEIVVPRPLPTVRGDHVRIREVLVNLLSNALKYNDQPARRVEVGHLAPGEGAEARGGVPDEVLGETVFYVRDNGIGIDQRHVDQVWAMFKRLHARDAYGGGTGAGLTIVRKVVERHGGRAWLESAIGVGTTVFFTLPTASGQERAP